jgi:hypothetical protein
MAAFQLNLSAQLHPTFVQSCSFAKKAGGRGDSVADSTKAAAVTGSSNSKGPASKSGSQDVDSSNAEAVMQGIVRILRCACCALMSSRRPLNQAISCRTEFLSMKVGQADPRILESVKVSMHAVDVIDRTKRIRHVYICDHGT